jgi:uncharacterized protein YggT (Ycf19 family)
MTYQDRTDEHIEKAPNPQAATADPAPSRNIVSRKVTRAIWIMATVLDVLLGFRLLLKLFAANPNSPFARLIYSASDYLVYPFQNLVANPSIGGGVFEITTLIAMLVYLFLTWLLIELAILITRR